MRFQRAAEAPRQNDGEKPGDDGDGFAEQAANQAHDGGDEDDGEDDVVDCDHSVTSLAATPSKQARHCTQEIGTMLPDWPTRLSSAARASAEARSRVGPTRTRYSSRPLLVMGAMNVANPLAVMSRTRRSAFSRLPKLPSCTTKVPGSARGAGAATLFAGAMGLAVTGGAVGAAGAGAAAAGDVAGVAASGGAFMGEATSGSATGASLLAGAMGWPLPCCASRSMV